MISTNTSIFVVVILATAIRSTALACQAAPIVGEAFQISVNWAQAHHHRKDQTRNGGDRDRTSQQDALGSTRSAARSATKDLQKSNQGMIDSLKRAQTAVNERGQDRAGSSKDELDQRLQRAIREHEVLADQLAQLRKSLNGGGSQWWQEMQNIINNSPIVPIIEQQLLVDFEAFKQREIANLEELKQQIEDALSGFGEAAGNFANTRK